METKKDLETKAKPLIKTSPDEAVMLYRRIWDEYPTQFNDWDAMFTMQALNLVQTVDFDWAVELVQKYTDEKVQGQYGWLIYNKFLKKHPRNDILRAEDWIVHLCGVVPQKNLQENATFPCPITMSVFKMVDAYTESLFNARKVNEWLERLNPKFLSVKSLIIKTADKGDMELASDLEKYYALRTKALLKLNRFEDCKMLCQFGLKEITKFHYDNDLWLQMRIAIADEKMGNIAESEAQFKSLLATKAGHDKWFLHNDIAELYFEQKDYDKALKYAIDAAFFGNEPHFMIGLYRLQARILYGLERPDEGKVLAQLICAILKEQHWAIKAEYHKLFNFYKLDVAQIDSSKVYLKEAQTFWKAEKFGDLPLVTGEVIFIHANGKVGKIKDVNGNVIGFHRKSFVKKQKTLEDLNGATVQFIIMESFDGNNIAENITVVKMTEKAPPHALVGKELKGTVKNIAEFGLFIQLDEHPKGLLHKSNLPKDMRNSFQESFHIGDVITVKIIGVTDKGLQLKLSE